MMIPQPAGALEKAPIEVRLFVPSPIACVGQPALDLEAVLTNSSDQAVELSEDGVVHDISFLKYENGKQIDGTGMLLDLKPGHWITIAPHQSVVVPFTEPITGKAFAVSGLFTVQIGFALILKNPEQYSKFPDSVPSNKAMFFVSNCKGDPAVPPPPASQP
jgi:hypothetical protein